MWSPQKTHFNASSQDNAVTTPPTPVSPDDFEMEPAYAAGARAVALNSGVYPLPKLAGAEVVVVVVVLSLSLSLYLCLPL